MRPTPPLTSAGVPQPCGWTARLMPGTPGTCLQHNRREGTYEHTASTSPRAPGYTPSCATESHPGDWRDALYLATASPLDALGCRSGATQVRWCPARARL